ncbi:MAG: hypothetical protein HY903_19460 [Deltaproteobacteria bacterium]|nr:hypothetical protein [Deltaproteobacteria bacterium]
MNGNVHPSAWCLPGALLLSAAPAGAHTLGRSFIDVTPTASGAAVLLDFDTTDLTETLGARLDSDGSGRVDERELVTHERVLLALATGGLVLHRGGARCRPDVAAPSLVAEGLIRCRLAYTCGSGGPWAVDYPLIEQMRAGHVGLLALRLEDRVVTARLSRATSAWSEATEAAGHAAARQSLRLRDGLIAGGVLVAVAALGLGVRIRRRRHR